MTVHPEASIIPFNGKTPLIHPSAFIAPGCRIIGDVEIGPDVSIWYNCVIRADVNFIRIGALRISGLAQCCAQTRIKFQLCGDESIGAMRTSIEACKNICANLDAGRYARRSSFVLVAYARAGKRTFRDMSFRELRGSLRFSGGI